MAIRNFFNPNGSATDDITQLKSLVDASSTGDVDDVVQQQIINKYHGIYFNNELFVIEKK